MVTIKNDVTHRTMIDAFRERHDLTIATIGTVLRRISRVDFDKLSTGPFCLVREMMCKVTPFSVHNTLGKVVILNHSIDGQIFYSNETELIDYSMTDLMSEIMASIGNSFVNARYNLLSFMSIWCILERFAQAMLCLCQSFFISAKESWIVNLFARRQGSKGVQSNINTNLFIRLWQWLWFYLTRDYDEPFFCRGTSDTNCFGSAQERSVFDDSHIANLGQIYGCFIQVTTTWCLRITKRVVTIWTAKARVSWFLTRFDTTKECLKSQVYSNSYVLQDLRMNDIQGKSFLFEHGQDSMLIIQCQTLTCLLMRYFTLLKQIVVEPAALLQDGIHFSDLTFSRVETKLKCFTHTPIIAQIKSMSRDMCYSFIV